MGILNVLWRNLGRQARTRAVGDVLPTPAGFRGLIEHDPALCTGCTTCAQVCAPGAIAFDWSDRSAVAWSFSAGQCSFCGLCVQYCPTGAITNKGRLPPATANAPLHPVVHRVEYRRCAHCSRRIIPLPHAMLQRLYDGTPTDAAIEQQTLCADCRRRQTSREMRNAFLGPVGGRGRTTT